MATQTSIAELVEVPRPENLPHTEAQATVWALLADVLDPEVPALSVVDLGLIRDVRIAGDGSVAIDVSPTYTGCPATALIHDIIKLAVRDGGFETVTINTVLSPAWSSDWISEEGRVKLEAYGIAPPVKGSPSGKAALFAAVPELRCPKCKSMDTEQVSEFGSTACKALYRCKSCLEPFEYFKCI